MQDFMSVRTQCIATCLFRPNFAYMTTVTVDLCYARPTSTGAELNSHVMGESIFKTGYYLGLKYYKTIKM